MRRGARRREVPHPVGGFAHENILQSGVNRIDNKCLRICEPYGERWLPFYLMQLSLVFFLSAYSIGCHTAAAAAHGEGENAWLQCPLVAAGAICVVETCRELLKEEKLVQGVQSCLKLCSALKKKQSQKKMSLSLLLRSATKQKHIFKEHIFGNLMRI